MNAERNTETETLPSADDREYHKELLKSNRSKLDELEKRLSDFNLADFNEVKKGFYSEMFETLIEDAGEGTIPGVFDIIAFNKKYNPEWKVNYKEIEQRISNFIEKCFEKTLSQYEAAIAIIGQSKNIEEIEKRNPTASLDRNAYASCQLIAESLIPAIRSRTKGNIGLQRKLNVFESRAKRIMIQLENKTNQEKIEPYMLVALKNQLSNKLLPPLTKENSKFFDIKFIQIIFDQIGVRDSVSEAMDNSMEGVENDEVDFFNFIKSSKDPRDKRISSKLKKNGNFEFEADGIYGDILYLSIKYLQFKKYGNNPQKVTGILNADTAQILLEKYKETKKLENQ
ncbi:MAG: peptidoglycan-binding domain-containing protein [Patescibacteria group bacterium]